MPTKINKTKTTTFQKIPAETKVRGSRVIAITGGSGSGKSLLARYIAEFIYGADCEIISHDMYYIDKDNFDPNYRVDYDAPESLDNVLLRKHLAQLKAGKAVDTPIYDFKTRDRLTRTRKVESRKIIIVEGILTLAIPELRELADLSIFIHVDDDARLARRITRDFIGGARSGMSGEADSDGLAGEFTYYFDYVKPNYQKYIAPLAEVADIVIHNNAKTPQPMLDRVSNILTKFKLV